MHGDKYNVICVMRGTNIARLGIPVYWKIDPAMQGVRKRVPGKKLLSRERILYLGSNVR